jgi:hypothetical protein
MLLDAIQAKRRELTSLINNRQQSSGSSKIIDDRHKRLSYRLAYLEKTLHQHLTSVPPNK